MRHKFANGTCLLRCIIVETLEHLAKCPLCPFIISGFASAHFTTPIEGESNLVELFAIARDVLLSSHRRMLSCLNGILLSWQTISIVSHWVEHIETALTLVACIDVGSYVSQWVTNVKSCSRGIRKHIEYVVFGLIASCLCVIGAFFRPCFTPSLFNVSEIIFHISGELYMLW